MVRLAWVMVFGLCLQINQGTKASPVWVNVTGITTVGDIAIGVSGGQAARLAVGSNRQVLQSDGTNPVWTTKGITTRGDILRGDSSGIEERLAVGTNQQVLLSDGTDVAWGTSPGIAGSIEQIVETSSGALVTLSTASLPEDDTIPQNNEGSEAMTLAITPVNTNNKLQITFTMVVGTGLDQLIAALFQDSTAGALAATMTPINANGTGVLTLTHTMTAGTTSATTFKVRIGGASGTQYLNGASGGTRLLGGVMSSSIQIKEIKV